MNTHRFIFFLILINFIYFDSVFCLDQEQSYNLKSDEHDILKVRDEIRFLRSNGYKWRVLITKSDTPVLKKIVDKYLMQFSLKYGVNSDPNVYIDFDSFDYDNYGFFYDGNNILLGDGLLEILFSNQQFEKYFAALLAHEFGHFCLKHQPKSILAQEINADKFALTVVDNPLNVVDAHQFHFLCMLLANAMLECFKYNDNDVNQNVGKVMTEIVNSESGFSMFYYADSWKTVEQFFCAACLKLGCNASVDFFVENFTLILGQVGNSNFSKELKIVENIKYPFLKDEHPSPKQISNLCFDFLKN